MRFLFLILLLCAPVMAQITTPPSGPALFSSGGGGGVAAADVCLLAGSADCLMVGPVYASVGSAAAPSIAIADTDGDRDMGMYRHSTGGLGFSVQGVQSYKLSKLNHTFVLNGTTDAFGASFNSGFPTFDLKIPTTITVAGQSASLPGIRFGIGNGIYSGAGASVGIAIGSTDRFNVGSALISSNVKHAFPKNTIGSIGFTGALTGVGIYYDDITAPANPLLAIQGATSAKSSIALITPPGFGGDITLSSAGDVVQTTLNASLTLKQTGDVVVTGNQLRLPRLVTAGTTTLPTCSAAADSGMFYRDDTSDAVVGQPCVCTANAARTVFTWSTLAGAACPP